MDIFVHKYGCINNFFLQKKNDILLQSNSTCLPLIFCLGCFSLHMYFKYLKMAVYWLIWHLTMWAFKKKFFLSSLESSVGKNLTTSVILAKAELYFAAFIRSLICSNFKLLSRTSFTDWSILCPDTSWYDRFSLSILIYIFQGARLCNPLFSSPACWRVHQQNLCGVFVLRKASPF